MFLLPKSDHDPVFWDQTLRSMIVHECGTQMHCGIPEIPCDEISERLKTLTVLIMRSDPNHHTENHQILYIERLEPGALRL